MKLTTIQLPDQTKIMTVFRPETLPCLNHGIHYLLYQFLNLQSQTIPILLKVPSKSKNPMNQMKLKETANIHRTPLNWKLTKRIRSPPGPKPHLGKLDQCLVPRRR